MTPPAKHSETNIPQQRRSITIRNIEQPPLLSKAAWSLTLFFSRLVTLVHLKTLSFTAILFNESRSKLNDNQM
ncbi:hypothetical protein C6H65_07595 [Photorhabdus luminescens]|nr:hypothetical protein C6H65_07595 [Photorhabdus luminescens]